MPTLKVEPQLRHVRSTEGVSGVEAVLSCFRDTTDQPIGKAIMLAVMLDKDECGESRLDTSTRERAVQLFEEIFRDLASA